MKQEIIKLRNLNSKFIFMKGKDNIVVYKSNTNNNIIVFDFDYEACIVDDICNATTEKPYDYLINELNNKDNLVILWSKVEGTTSDYDIYYNVYYDKIMSSVQTDNSKEYLNSLIDGDNDLTHKYRTILNGKLSNIVF